MKRSALTAWTRGGALAALFLLLPACRNSGKDLDALQLENAQLRERNAALETGSREKDLRIADLESRGDAPGDTGFEGISGAETRRAGGNIIVDVAGDVLFDSGSIVLKSSAKRSLDEIASVLESRYPDNRISVEGHTDTDPIRRSKWQTNERLSAERALAVEAYLVQRGVSNSRICSVAYGPSDPKGSKPASRRVEIVVMAE